MNETIEKNQAEIEKFNLLAELLEMGEAIDTYCTDREDCYRTMAFINSLVKKMNELMEKIE